tara:strand:- start:19027 stop:19533 length:507 start_codon:yes stop_codon:yes gene_type:complete
MKEQDKLDFEAQLNDFMSKQKGWKVVTCKKHGGIWQRIWRRGPWDDVLIEDSFIEHRFYAPELGVKESRPFSSIENFIAYFADKFGDNMKGSTWNEQDAFIDQESLDELNFAAKNMVTYARIEQLIKKWDKDMEMLSHDIELLKVKFDVKLAQRDELVAALNKQKEDE